MLERRLGELSVPNGLLPQVAVGFSCGLLLAIACLMFSLLLVLGALMAALFIVATLKRPEIGLLGILIATSSIVFEEQLPLISVGSVSLHVPDILLLGSLGLIAVRWLVEPEFRIVGTPLDRPLLIFCGVTRLSTSIAIFQSSAEVQAALRATRVLSYYLTFFAVTNLVRERRQLNILLNGLFLLATLVAAAMVVQFMLGDSVQLISGRVETLNTQGTSFEGVSRISPPGFSLVLVSFVAILCSLVLERLKPSGWLKFLQFALLGMALLVTFLRSYWAVLIMVAFLLVVLFRGADRQRLVGWGLLVISLVAMIRLLAFGDRGRRATSFVGAAMDRLSTLGNIGTYRGQDSSFNWRMLENGYAFSTIAAHPWIGLGMGFTYRPYDR